MSRLPTVGGDAGNWGEVLNDYLSQSHTTDGKLRLDIATIAALKALDVSTIPDKMQVMVGGYYAHGDGGGGQFYYDQAASDTDNGGTIIAPTAGSGRWKRIYSDTINVKHFGAKGDGTTNDNDAFRIASSVISAAGGGTLIIPPATYIIGKQDFAGAAGQGYAYRAHDVIKISNCTKPVKVVSHGAVLKNAAGLKYGSFNPTTGGAMGSIQTGADYRADAPTHIWLADCTSGVTIDGPIELDGNSSNLTAGGEFGDVGYQVYGSGVMIRDNVLGLDARNIYTHNHVVDGFTLSDLQATSFDARPINARLSQIRSEYNGRQGISMTGGIGITVYDSQFLHTQRGAVVSPPGAGVDIEPNPGYYTRDILFVRCLFANNKATQFLSDSVAASRVREVTCVDCTMQSSDAGTIWVRVPRVTFTGCKIKGGQVTYTYTAPFAGHVDRTKFYDCEFSDEIYSGVAPVSAQVNQPLSNIGLGTFFSNCHFHNKNYATSGRRFMAYSFYNVSHEYNNCVFENFNNQEVDGTYIGIIRGCTFTGRNSFIDHNTGANKYYINYDNTAQPATFHGPVEVSGGTLKWSNATTGFTGDISQYYRTLGAKYVQMGTSTAGTVAKITSSAALPTSGQWNRGDIIINTSVAAAGQNSYWQCITAGWLAAAWTGSTAYGVGQVRKNGSDFYIVTTSGTSASSGGPTGQGTGIVDGTVTWDWLSGTTAVLQAKTL